MTDTRNMQILKSIALVADSAIFLTLTISFLTSDPNLWLLIAYIACLILSLLPHVVAWASKGEG